MEKYEHHYLMHKSNIVIVVIGLLFMLVGFLVMTGGASNDPMIYPAEEIYGFRRTILAPFLILVGLVIQIFAILKQPKSTSEHND